MTTETETFQGKGHSKVPNEYSNFIAANDERPWDDLNKVPINQSTNQWKGHNPTDEKLSSAVYDIPYIPTERFDLSEADFAPSFNIDNKSTYTGPLDHKEESVYDNYSKQLLQNGNGVTVSNHENHTLNSLDEAKDKQKIVSQGIEAYNYSGTNSNVINYSGTIDLNCKRTEQDLVSAHSDISNQNGNEGNAFDNKETIGFHTEFRHIEPTPSMGVDSLCSSSLSSGEGGEKYPIQVVDKFTPLVEEKPFPPSVKENNVLGLSNGYGESHDGQYHFPVTNQVNSDTNLMSLTNQLSSEETLYAAQSINVQNSMIQSGNSYQNMKMNIDTNKTEMVYRDGCEAFPVKHSGVEYVKESTPTSMCPESDIVSPQNFGISNDIVSPGLNDSDYYSKEFSSITSDININNVMKQNFDSTANDYAPLTNNTKVDNADRLDQIHSNLVPKTLEITVANQIGCDTVDDENIASLKGIGSSSISGTNQNGCDMVDGAHITTLKGIGSNSISGINFSAPHEVDPSPIHTNISTNGSNNIGEADTTVLNVVGFSNVDGDVEDSGDIDSYLNDMYNYPSSGQPQLSHSAEEDSVYNTCPVPNHSNTDTTDARHTVSTTNATDDKHSDHGMRVNAVVDVEQISDKENSHFSANSEPGPDTNSTNQSVHNNDEISNMNNIPVKDTTITPICQELSKSPSKTLGEGARPKEMIRPYGVQSLACDSSVGNLASAISIMTPHSRPNNSVVVCDNNVNKPQSGDIRSDINGGISLDNHETNIPSKETTTNKPDIDFDVPSETVESVDTEMSTEDALITSVISDLVSDPTHVTDMPTAPQGMVDGATLAKMTHSGSPPPYDFTSQELSDSLSNEQTGQVQKRPSSLNLPPRGEFSAAERSQVPYTFPYEKSEDSPAATENQENSTQEEAMDQSESGMCIIL